MKKRFLKNLFVCVLVACMFVGMLYTENVSAAAPDASQKTAAKVIELGAVEEGVTIGSEPNNIKSTYYKIKTKRPYNLNITVNFETDVRKTVEVVVYNKNGVSLRSGNQSKENMTYSKKKDRTQDKFTVKKLKKGTYYLEIKENGSEPNHNYKIKVVPTMIEKVKEVSARQTSTGSKTAVVKWKAFTGEAVSGYKVYRATKKKGKYRLVKTVWGIDQNSAEVKVTPGRTYYFKVRAFYFAHIENVDKNYYSKYSAAVKLETK